VPVVLNPEIAKLAVLLLALAIDLACGDPPNRYHPVAWIGRLLGAGQRWLCHGSPARLLVGGALATLGVVGLAAAAAALVSRVAAELGIAGLLLEAVALTCLLSLRDLIGAARSVAGDLARGDLPAARRAVGYHLVSRPTADLDESQVASATIESVAENLTDSLVAPVCFFLAGGLVGAAVYRAINTADSMLGFRRGPLEYFGKSAARLDDLLNLIPARVAGLSLVAGAALAGESGSGALAVLRRDHGRTQSPNSGWPMAAMAGALGVALEKPDVHRLGAGAPPRAADVERAIRVVAAASVVSVGFVVAVFLAAATVLAPVR
jgi:adenosylcobinamide-phosphate synthase